MDALRRSHKGLCKAVSQYGNNAVQVSRIADVVADTLLHPYLSRCKAVDGLPLRNVPQVCQLLRGGAESVSGGPGVSGGLAGVGRDVIQIKAGVNALQAVVNTAPQIKGPADLSSRPAPKSLPAAQASPYSIRWIW